VIVGASLLVLAAVNFVMSTNYILGAYDWSASAAVPIDGRAHTLRLPSHSTAVVWFYEGDNTPRCHFADSQTHKPLPIEAEAADYWRPGGRASGNTGTRTLDSGSGRVIGRCFGDGISAVYVEEKPHLSSFLADLAWNNGLVAPGLALAGSLLILLSSIAQVRRRRLQHA
jgi:hypothetical protein